MTPRETAAGSSSNRLAIGPQPGPQEIFLATSADIAIYGGAAGGGKTWALLMEPLRHAGNPEFGAVIFRRTSPQIRNEGGLWDESEKLYPYAGARPKQATLEWRFPSGARFKFAHLQHEKDRLSWQGSQLPFIGFDELTHFTEAQFWYLLSRNRSMCGVRPYVRAGTNPDAHSWVRGFLKPWLDRDHPQRAESGEIRWFVRDGGAILWVPPGTPDAKSVTFVRSSVYDNRKLLEKDPGYLANLKALNPVDRARLLDGDWDIVAGGNFFKRHWFKIVDAAPADLIAVCRFWDFAATEPKPGKDPDWTVGVLLGLTGAGRFIVLDVLRDQTTPGGVEELIKQTEALDRQAYGSKLITRGEQEPGSSGVAWIDNLTRKVLTGRDFKGVRSTGNKNERAKPLSAQAEAGNVDLLKALWNEGYLNELAAFPTAGVHDDQVDATSGAMSELAQPRELQTAPSPFQ